MQREIHVNSYVKRDGTHVREHVRNVNTIGSFAPKQESQKIIFEENPNKTNPVLYYSDELGGEFSEYGSPRVLTGGIGYYDFQDGTVDVGTVDRGSSGGGSVGNIVSEGLVDFGMSLMDTFTFGKMADTNSLWKMAADKLEHESKYIDENGSLIESIEQLQPNVRDTVRQKLIQQINQEDARGVIFYSWSTLAKGIGHSKEFNEYVVKNIDKLNKGEIIESGSTYFGSDINLKYALGHADILFTQIDKDGNVSAIIMDTYDFNKSDTNWMVKIAYDVQDAGLIENYYLLVHILVPLYEIFGF